MVAPVAVRSVRMVALASISPVPNSERFSGWCKPLLLNLRAEIAASKPTEYRCALLLAIIARLPIKSSSG